MIRTLIHSPTSYFDSTPSGVLINRFSKDLGLLDNNIIFSLIVGVEGVLSVLGTMANVCLIDSILIPPALIASVLIIVIYVYSRPVIISCKELDLQSKSPIIHFFNETLKGLTQIRIYQRRRINIQEMQQKLNASSRASLNFHLTARGFGKC